MRRRGLVSEVGNVNLRGYEEKLYYTGHLANRQHEGEISEMLLKVKAKEVRRLHQVDPEFRADVELVLGGKTVYWEHHRGTMGAKQIQEKVDRYETVERVLWTCNSRAELDKLAGMVSDSRHLFTLYDLAIDDFHGRIWVDHNETVHPLGLS